MKNIEDIYELSPMQQGMLFHTLYAPGSGTYFNQLTCMIKGRTLDTEIFKQCWENIIGRHAVLRTSFHWENLDKPMQVVHMKAELPWTYHDWRGVPFQEQGTRVRHFLARDREKGFQLQQAPLVRCTLIRLTDETYHFTWSHHHILMDGWCLHLLVKEMITIYEALVQKRPFNLGSTRPYRDFIQWLQSQEKEKAKNFWQQELNGFHTVTLLTSPTPRNSPGTYQQLEFELPGQLFTGLTALARTHALTLNILAQAAWSILLNRYGGTPEVLYGATVSGRPPAIHGVESMIGLFINTLPVRVCVDNEKSLLPWLQQFQAKQAQRDEYAYCSLIDIREWSDIPRGISMFDSLVVYENYPGDDSPHIGLEELEVTGVEVFEQGNYPLNILLMPRNGLSVKFHYDTNCFEPAVIQCMGDHFRALLEGMVRNPGFPIGAYSLLNENEKHRLLIQWNNTHAGNPPHRCITGWFEHQVQAAPDNTALVFKQKVLTYRELNRKANQLAHYFQKLGVGADVLVGICVERSLEMVIGIMGILKAGGAYVPLDPTLPGERHQFMKRDANIRVLVTREELKKTLPGSIPHIIYLDIPQHAAASEPQTNPVCAVTSRHLAYVIYTSGSTGKPKGVLLIHDAVCNLIKEQVESFDIKEGDRVLQFASLNFDASVSEIFSALLSGAVLVLHDKDALFSPHELMGILRNQQINIVTLPPVVLSHLPADGLPGLKTVISAGEKCSPGIVKSWSPGRKLINGYGPTEYTVSTTLYPIKQVSGPLPIGAPILNTKVYIVDDKLQPVPIMVPGELCISGMGLARGYLNKPDLTKKKFVLNPFRETIKTPGGNKNLYRYMYRSGDLVRWLPVGNMEFLGRLDHQVKIRGFRIELGEIESQLLNHENINETVVLAKEDERGDKYLCAYIAGGKQLSLPELREYLSPHLPAYMIPSYFVQLESFPLTSSGKIDRRALPDPGFKAGDDYVAPRNEIEVKLVGIWSDVLGIEKNIIGIDTNFFELGGHSLKATMLVTKIHREFNVKLSLAEVFKSPSIRGLSGCIKEASQQRYASIEPVEKKDYYELSPAQKRLFILQQMDTENTTYNMPQIIPLTEGIEPINLENTFKKLITRHDSFRTSFEMTAETIVQRIHRQVDFAIEYYEARKNEIEDILSRFTRPFDLSQPPLLRVGMEKTASSPPIVLVDMHHIITDGISQTVLQREFMPLCRDEELPPLRLQYKDYAQWRNSENQEALIKQQELYWLREFSDDVPVLNLPTDYPRPLVQSFEGRTVEFVLEKNQLEILKYLARQANATLYMSILSVFYILLSKLSGQEDIVVGSPVAGRHHADLESIIGMFVNTLALRNYPSGEKTVKRFIQELKDRTLEAFDNQEYQFEDLVDKVPVPRDVSRNPLFDVMFNLLSQEDYPGDISQMESDGTHEYREGVSKFDLTLTALEIGEGILLSFEYCTRLFKTGTVEKIITYFKKILFLLSEDSDRKISDLEIITRGEKQQILYVFNDTGVQYPGHKTIHTLFAEQAERTPDNIAVVGPAQVKYRAYTTYMTYYISYRELNQKSDQLAGLLRSRGLKPGSIVGIMMNRSPEMMTGILGILKTGCAYLPIDPDYPEERINYMLKDSGTKILLKDNDFTPEAFNNRLMGTSSHLHLSPAPITSLAYVIFTSGSTGKPKGVMITHRNVVNFITGMTAEIEFKPGKTILALTTISFDIFVLETLLPLTLGLKVVIANETQQKDPGLLTDIIVKLHVGMLQVTPSRLQSLAAFKENLDSLAGLEVLMVGGEALPDHLFKRVKEKFPGKIYNLYGPTETTVWSMLKDLAEVDKITIGKPIANTQVYITDVHGMLQPVGIVGELCIGGDGTARGYLNNPELTADKFIFYRTYKSYMTYIPKKLYKTGDLARWLPDGNIEFLGRIDNQVKIRGFRIETAEIEIQLISYENIKEAVVVVRIDETGNAYLCAYIVSDKELPLSQLREHLSKTLPDYMIPSYFVPLEAVPLTPNEKVNRKALPDPEFKADDDRVAPGDEIEVKLVEIWSEVLGIETDIISINANFFALGGHSLKATIMAAKTQKSFNITIPLVEIFKSPTVKGLAEYIKRTSTETISAKDDNLVLLIKTPHKDNHIFFIHDVTGEIEGYVEFCRHFNNLNNRFNCWGIRADRLKNCTPKNVTIEDIAGGYIEKIKKVQPHGPYYIVGWSLGGTIAFEIIRQLEQWNDHIALLTLIDSPGPRKDAIENVTPFTLERESLYDFNVGRTLTNARACYIPSSKINTQLHYFKASQTREKFLNDWNNYCIKPIKSYEISGDHYSILKIPQVLEFTKIFEKVM